MDSQKQTEPFPALPSPSALLSPATLSSSVTSPSSPFGSKGKMTANVNANTASSPNTISSPDPLKRPSPLSRTQTQTTSGIFTPRITTTAHTPSGEPVDETARTNALWAEMRATLAEVELSASRGTQQTHFFGSTHAKALEDLRTAQIALAQAWAQADSDGGEDGTGGEQARRENQGDNVSPGGSVLHAGEPGKDEVKRQTRPHRSSSAASNGSASLDASSLEAERDIATAKVRREANDRYFYRVSKGVMDVVGKLEEVARAMGSVERASRSVWSDDEDSDLDRVESRPEAANTAQNEKDDPE